MEKEELKKLKEWCEAAAAAVNTLSAVKKMAPESIVLISEFPTDKEVHVFSDRYVLRQGVDFLKREWLMAKLLFSRLKITKRNN